MGRLQYYISDSMGQEIGFLRLIKFFFCAKKNIDDKDRVLTDEF